MGNLYRVLDNFENKIVRAPKNHKIVLSDSDNQRDLCWIGITVSSPYSPIVQLERLGKTNCPVRSTFGKIVMLDRRL